MKMFHLCFAWILVAIGGFAQAASLSQFDGHGDIGSPKLAGSATYDSASQEYRVSAGGFNMWGQRDEFHFLWKHLKGDFILQARVEFVGKGVDPHRKLGWIVRSTLDADAAYADGTVHGDGLTSLQFRRAKGGITEQVRSSATSPDFIQLERRGSDYIFAVARFGEPLVTCQTNLVLGDDVYAGLFLCSHNSNVVEKAIFRDVRLIRPAAANFVPYRDYIGSHLEILDVATGRRELIHSSTKPFEAPNWTTDGRALIYNSSGRDANYRGRLYRFDLATRQVALIPTDFATRNNNDHVLSFDGTMLGISHHATNDEFNNWFPHISPDGKWIAFLSFTKDVAPADHPYYKHVTLRLMPIGGGTPKVIAYVYGGQGTINVPSWSPDSRKLAFVSNSDSF